MAFKQCKKCGEDNSQSAMFCAKCGSSLKNSETKETANPSKKK